MWRHIIIKNRKKNFGQVFLVTVFVISVAMFSSLLTISPIKNKLSQIKEMEYVYQALANSEKALEVSMYYSINSQLPLDNLTSSMTTTELTTSCASYTTTTLGTCKKTTIEQTDSNDFKSYYYSFETSSQSFFGISLFFGYVRNISRTLTEQ